MLNTGSLGDMMLIEIRVVILVPPEDKHYFDVAIEKITECATTQFPSLSVSPHHSPVTVTIRGLEDKADG